MKGFAESTSVASVTTAFNAVRELPRHLEVLLRQNRPLQEIVVVDNHSSDGTAEFLAERFPQVTVLQMPANLGAAGAWAAGLAYAALQRKHDWVWAFDDDSLPGPEALERLLAAESAEAAGGAEIGMLAMSPVHQPTRTCYSPLLWRHGFHKPPAEVSRQPVWFADLAIASGLLVRREVVECIGLPRADFFMDFFDFEYCLRARSQGFQIAVVTCAELAHEVGEARAVRLPGYSAVWPDHAPWREYYMSRNMVYVAWWLHSSPKARWMTLRHLLRHASGSLMFGSRKFACMKKMAQGFRDGTEANLGIRFLPAESLPSRPLAEFPGRDSAANQALRPVGDALRESVAQKG